jgi:hypothetical protein
VRSARRNRKVDCPTQARHPNSAQPSETNRPVLAVSAKRPRTDPSRAVLAPGSRRLGFGCRPLTPSNRWLASGGESPLGLEPLILLLNINFRRRPREASGDSFGLVLRFGLGAFFGGLRSASTALLHNCSALELPFVCRAENALVERDRSRPRVWAFIGSRLVQRGVVLRRRGSATARSLP